MVIEVLLLFKFISFLVLGVRNANFAIQCICVVLGYSYERLDGSVRGEERYLAIKNFNQDEDTFIFLLSTRAGMIDARP